MRLVFSGNHLTLGRSFNAWRVFRKVVKDAACCNYQTDIQIKIHDIRYANASIIMKGVAARSDSHVSVIVDIHATTKKRLSTQQALSTRVFSTRGTGKPGHGASWDYFVKLSPPEREQR